MKISEMNFCSMLFVFSCELWSHSLSLMLMVWLFFQLICPVSLSDSCWTLKNHKTLYFFVLHMKMSSNKPGGGGGWINEIKKTIIYNNDIHRRINVVIRNHSAEDLTRLWQPLNTKSGKMRQSIPTISQIKTQLTIKNSLRVCIYK